MKQQSPHNTERASSRQLKIEECLLQNLLKIPFDKLSVADLCRQMGISRRLYYTYYPDKESCLFSMIDRAVGESMDAFPATEPAAALTEENVIPYLVYWLEHRDFLDMIAFQGLNGIFIDRSFSYIQQNSADYLPYLSTPEVEADDSVLWLFTTIRFAVLLQWREHNYETPVEEMATRYLRILKNPIVHDHLS